MDVGEVVAAASAPQDPGAALAAVVALRRLADELEAGAVAAAHEEAWSWAEIGEALGVSKQAVHKKHGKRLRGR